MAEELDKGLEAFLEVVGKTIYSDPGCARVAEIALTHIVALYEKRTGKLAIDFLADRVSE